MSDLRTRIAGLARFHIPFDYAGGLDCGCGMDFKPDRGGIDVADQMWAEHVADKVIEELGLQRQSGWADEAITLGAPADSHRYITDWIADE